MDIYKDVLDSFEVIVSLTEKEISNMSKRFSERTVATIRIIFGLNRTNILNPTVRWVQASQRISRGTTLVSMGTITHSKKTDV